MAKIDEFFPYVQPAITACPNPLVRNAIREAAIEFCKKSQAWAVRLPRIAYVEGQSAYALTVPAEAQIVEILNIWGPSWELKGKSLNELSVLLPTWQTQKGAPMYFVSDNVDYTLEVFPMPDSGSAGGQMLVRIAYAPTITAATLPDFLLNRYSDAIAYGAKARLMQTKDQPWSDPVMGMKFERMFGAECDDARNEQLHGRVAGSIQVKPRPFGAN